MGESKKIQTKATDCSDRCSKKGMGSVTITGEGRPEIPPQMGHISDHHTQEPYTNTRVSRSSTMRHADNKTSNRRCTMEDQTPLLMRYLVLVECSMTEARAPRSCGLQEPPPHFI